MDYVSRYSLAGLHEATVEPQNALIERAKTVAAQDDRILAVYLVGGFAVGTADAWSDVDLQFTVRDESAEDVAATWRDVANAIAATAYIKPFAFSTGGVCITPEWLHFDVVFNSLSAVDLMTVEGMVPLLDKAGILPTEPIPRPNRQGPPLFPLAAVEHFLYMLGNMVSVIGRNEVIPASNGVIMVRDVALVSLLLAERGWSSTREHQFGNPFPFTKQLRTYLTDEQNQLLVSLPPLEATIDSVIEGYVALARIFLPRARRLAELTGAEWPAAYERASVGFFEQSLGISIGTP
jgi:hypothetical protein